MCLTFAYCLTPYWLGTDVACDRAPSSCEACRPYFACLPKYLHSFNISDQSPHAHNATLARSPPPALPLESLPIVLAAVSLLALLVMVHPPATGGYPIRSIDVPESAEIVAVDPGVAAA